jgi:transposase-like protein
MEVQPTDDLLDGGWFTTEELAGMLGVDPSTLRRWRTARPRQGPPFVCLSSRVTLYSARDVRRWLTTRRIDPGQAA